MKTLVRYLFLGFTVLCISGCASFVAAKPLKLSPYRRNIIIRQDASVLIESETIDFRKLQKELAKRAFVDKDRIALHTHEDVPPQVFEAVFDALMKLGYRNIQSCVYTDNP